MAVYKYRHHRKIYYYFRVNINGKQFSRRLEKNSRFHSEDEARHVEALFLARHKAQNYTKNPFIDMIKDDFIDYLSYKYRSTTLYSFVKLFERFYLPILRMYRVKDLSESLFISINETINNLDIKDRHVYISVGKNFLNFLHRYNVVINDNVFISSKRNLVFEAPKINYWTKDEFDRFIDVVDDIYFKLLFSILYYYGLRIGELRGLKKENITKDKLIINSTITNKTLSKGQIESTTKTASSVRTFPMLNHIYELYLEFNKLYYFNSPYVFYSLNKDAHVIGETSIRRMLKKYCLIADVKYIHPHCFRHSCASLLINSGMDYLQVAAWLGHSSPQVTLSTYSHLFESRKNEIFHLLNNINHKK